MTLPIHASLDAIKKNALRFSSVQLAARERIPALAPFASIDALFAALRPGSSLAQTARDALLVAIVEEHQRAPHTLWQSVLVATFEPMLVRVRTRLGRRADEDLDQRVLAAFLEAIKDVRVGPFVVLAIRWATEGKVFSEARAEHRGPPVAEYDDDAYCADPFRAEAHEKAAAAELVRVIEAEGGSELLSALLATRAGDETLMAYVRRAHPDATHEDRVAAYDRLCRARLRVIAEVRARFVAPSRAEEAA